MAAAAFAALARSSSLFALPSGDRAGRASACGGWRPALRHRRLASADGGAGRRLVLPAQQAPLRLVPRQRLPDAAERRGQSSSARSSTRSSTCTSTATWWAGCGTAGCSRAGCRRGRAGRRARSRCPPLVGLGIGPAPGASSAARDRRATRWSSGAPRRSSALIVFISVVSFVSIGGNAFARYLFPLLPVAGILIGHRLRAPAVDPDAVRAGRGRRSPTLLLLHRFVIANGGVECERVAAPPRSRCCARRVCAARRCSSLLALLAVRRRYRARRRSLWRPLPGRHGRVARHQRRVAPAGASSSPCVPRSTMRPRSSTMIWSASRTVDSRWAITIVVRPTASASSASCTCALRLDVERAGRLVEHQHRRVAQDRSRDREALRLAAREPVAALADDGVEALRQPRQHVVDARRAGGVLQLLVGRVGAREAQVLADAAVEQVRLLRHDARPRSRGR